METDSVHPGPGRTIVDILEVNTGRLWVSRQRDLEESREVVQDPTAAAVRVPDPAPVILPKAGLSLPRSLQGLQLLLLPPCASSLLAHRLCLTALLTCRFPRCPVPGRHSTVGVPSCVSPQPASSPPGRVLLQSHPWPSQWWGHLCRTGLPHAQETARGCWAPCGHSAACSGGGPFLDEGPSKDQARLWCPQTLAHPSVAVTVHPCRPGANRDSSWPLPDTTRAPSIKKLSLTSQSGPNSKVSCYSL